VRPSVSAELPRPSATRSMPQSYARKRVFWLQEIKHAPLRRHHPSIRDGGG
jgi:hypothetical protein